MPALDRLHCVSGFLKLEGSRLFIDQPEYYLRDVAKIPGIVVSIARG